MKVSVIIPCFNVEQYISACLKSVEQQTYNHLEVICVNDGSTDRTQALIEEFISKSSLHIKLFNQANEGAPSARNNGLKNSNGKYIQFLDADDILQPSKIENQIELASNTSFPDLIVGSYSRENMNGEILSKKKYFPNDIDNIWLKLMNTDLGITSSNLFKSELFKNGIEWNESLQSSQEYDLMFQILKVRTKIVFDQELNTTVRVRKSGSISQNNSSQKWERYVRLRSEIIDYLKTNNAGIINNEIIETLFISIRMLYPYNQKKAKQYFEKYIPKGFLPSVSNATGRSYVLLYRLIGFTKTEKTRLFFTHKKAK